MTADEAASPVGLQRVTKLLAKRGVCSRREAERLIDAGEVLVEGRVVERGAKVHPDALIEVTTAGQRSLASAVTVALHKPVGIVSSLPEDGQREARSLIKATTLHGDCDSSSLRRVLSAADNLAVAGRLDRASRGLLILTSDGVVARALIGSHTISKSYVVTVDGDVAEGQLARLNRSMSLDDRRLLPMVVRRAGRGRLRFELVEGMKHQIRRCCGKVGLEVVDLFRDAVGPVRLGELPEGRWRPLGDGELAALRAAAQRGRGASESGDRS